MAVGGIFGVMNAMFAAVSQRTKDIGVLRILGYTPLAGVDVVFPGIAAAGGGWAVCWAARSVAWQRLDGDEHRGQRSGRRQERGVEADRCPA